MRILMISDIHANLPALLTLEPEIEAADLTLVGGDLIGYYCDVNEVIAFVIHHGLTCVRGNHDHFLLPGVPNMATGIRNSTSCSPVVCELNTNGSLQDTFNKGGPT